MNHRMFKILTNCFKYAIVTNPYNEASQNRNSKKDLSEQEIGRIMGTLFRVQ